MTSNLMKRNLPLSRISLPAVVIKLSGLTEGMFAVFGKSTAVKERARWLLEKMGKSVEKLGGLEKDNAEMMKLLSGSNK